jgi:hypothetical protein
MLIILLGCLLAARADEPLWTDEQRLEQRDTVTIATVIADDVVTNRDDSIDLHHAVIRVESMKKGKKTRRGSQLNIYYELSPRGVNHRCPDHADLNAGDKGTFYLRTMTEDIRKYLKLTTADEPAFFLEMGSDVQKESTEPAGGAYVAPAAGAPSAHP